MILVTLLLALIPSPTPSPIRAPGTYAIAFCSSPCVLADSARAPIHGTLVLDSATRGNDWSFESSGNGCFHLSRDRHFKGYAALFPSGYTAWRYLAPDSIAFDTYRSPDAGHDVVAVLNDSGFVGSGHSWGAGVAEIHVPDEYVVALRLGPPDIDRCPVVRAVRRDSWLSPLLFGAITLAAIAFLIPHH